jgi:HEPN domain-containing protein
MPHDHGRIADTRAWLHMASIDLRAGAADLAVDASLAGDAMFHAQQAAEKSLKAFLTWHDVPFRKTHDLREVLAACITIDQAFNSGARDIEGLTPAAWTFRYPGGEDVPSVVEADESLRIAKRLFDAILSRLPNEVHPY